MNLFLMIGAACILIPVFLSEHGQAGSSKDLLSIWRQKTIAAFEQNCDDFWVFLGLYFFLLVVSFNFLS